MGGQILPCYVRVGVCPLLHKRRTCGLHVHRHSQDTGRSLHPRDPLLSVCGHTHLGWQRRSRPTRTRMHTRTHLYTERAAAPALTAAGLAPVFVKTALRVPAGGVWPCGVERVFTQDSSL